MSEFSDNLPLGGGVGGEVSLHLHNHILPTSKPDFLGMLNGVNTMLPVNAPEQVGRVVLSRHLLLVDDVDAGLVERYGVGRGEDAIVLQLHGFGMIHAVAVY